MLSEFKGALKYCIPAFVVRLTRRRRGDVPAMSMARILVVRLDGLGDFVLFTAFLRELRLLCPESHICLVVRPNCYALAQACPYVNEVKLLDLGENGRPRSLRKLFKFAQADLDGRFDVAIQPRWDADHDWASLTAYLSGASRILGFTERTTRSKAKMNWAYDRLLTDVLPPGVKRHEADRNLDVIRYLGGDPKSNRPEVWFRGDDEENADEFFRQNRLPALGRPIFAFGIGAGNPRRQWPFYAELITAVSENLPMTALLVAGPEDLKAADRIRSVVRNSVVLGARPLREVAAILSRCSMFVGNDSGPLHLAAAVGLPLVEISCHPVSGSAEHANSPSRFGPISMSKSVIRPVSPLGKCKDGCQENFAHCIAQVTPYEVLESVMAIHGSVQKSVLPPAVAEGDTATVIDQRL